MIHGSHISYPQQQIVIRNIKKLSMSDEQYEEVRFPNCSPPPYDSDLKSEIFEAEPSLMTKKQETQMLYSININQNQNLLDLTYEQQECLVQKLQNIALMENRQCQLFDPVTIHDGYLLTYKLYKIKSRKKDVLEFDSCVERRFSDFQYLHDMLIQNYGGSVIPCLPQKNLWASLDMETAKDREIRKKHLERYLNRILQHSKLCLTEQVRSFLFDHQKNFSIKKGEYTSQHKIEDKIYKITYNIYQYGKLLAYQYLNTGNQSKTSPHYLPKDSKEKQILHYGVIIEDMEKLLSELKIIVIGTTTENGFADELNSLMESMEGKNELQFDEMNPSAGQQKVIESQYYDIVEFVKSCKEAIQRWSNTYIQLNKLKDMEKQLLDKITHNPRNIKLDMIRSQINKYSKRIQDWTKNLQAQLQSSIIKGKSEISRFLDKITEIKHKNYSAFK